MLNRVAPNETEFWVDAGSSDPLHITNCDTLVINNGEATIKKGGSCLRLLPSLCTNQNTSGKVTVSTSLGRITGSRDKMGFRFQGIRYAKAPVGSLRFAAPQPITTSWLNSVDATAPGNKCPQLGDLPGGAEDCLFLNVFTPKLNADAQSLLPVMFYLHGGSFTTGYGSDPAFNPANMASRGQVVVVTINYRLGLLGFLERVDAGINRSTLPGNQGVRDMVVALQWVKKFISDFGGDPSKVTIFGESAGGHAVRTLLSMPAATKGLFRAAISQSDPNDLPFNNVKTASTLVSGGAMALLNCDDLACMRSKNISDILAAQNTIVSQAISKAPEESFLELIKPSIDGLLIFDNFDQLIAGKNGGIHKVPLIIGTMKDEAIGFLPSLGQGTPMPPQVFGLTLGTILGYQRSMVTIGSNLYPIDGSNPDGVREAEGLFAADYLFVCPTQFLAKAYATTGANVYQFQFQKGYNPNRSSDDICANHVCHGDDVAIVFASPPLINNPQQYPWTAEDAALSRMVIDRWTAFATSGGNPNPTAYGGDNYPAWPTFDGSNQNVFMINTTPSISTGGIRPQYCGFLDNYIKYDFQL
ncbi:MAG: Alpha/Beta hydrolase protein [Benniella sp.]|nr:MAG: Alpha/Beta hydrolase protein [Benniella sp.]